MRTRIAATMKCPNQSGRQRTAAGENRYQTPRADAFTGSAASYNGRLAQWTQRAAARIAKSHSLAVAVGFFGSAFRGVNLTDAFAVLFHHHASLEELDANVAVVVKI